MKGTLGNWIAGLCLAMVSLTASAAPPKAIPFEFTDIEGAPVRLADLHGKWVLVNFWAPWCPLCWPEVPALNALNAREDVVVIGVAMDYGPDEPAARDAVTRHGMRFSATVLGGSRRDPNASSRQVGPVDFFPTSYLYDPSGEIVMFIPGPVREQRILAAMDNQRRLAGKDCPQQVATGAAGIRISASGPC